MKNHLQFMLAGKAILTAQSLKSKKHYTYKILKAKGAIGNCFLVFVLTGPDNSNDYTYMGMFNHDDGKGVFRTTKSRIAADAKSFLAFNWIYKKLKSGGLPAGLYLQHAGKCGRCGRKLTHPDSLETGIGPECAGRL